ncbi:TRADD-N-associated membrane domain-containing protein [Streptosporangium sp. LJ11]|uniref:TRADD-N-associated membrane domain-containing protein n=1 Tax=Streptosporangium sp. LJ11 TaxID=3436927 RepID=UPI003F78C030
MAYVQGGREQVEGLLPVLSLVAALAGLAFVAYCVYRITFGERRETQRAEHARQALQRAETSLGEADRLALPALWDVTHKRLDYYHQIATTQARQSFRNAQIAMTVGFVLLVVFAVLALGATTPTASIVTGALGAAAAAFAAYIGRTFVRSQESAAGHLRAYFDQPLEFSRYLAAERLLEAMETLEPEQRAAIAGDLLRAIVTPGQPALGPSAADSAKDPA